MSRHLAFSVFGEEEMRIPSLAGALLLLLSGEALFSGRFRAERQTRLPDPMMDRSAPVPVVMRRTELAATPAPEAPAAQVTPAAPPVQEVPSDTLADIAVADYREEGSVIYYNPVALRRLGPLISAFFMAHERGHVHLRHTRANALLAGRTALDSVLQARELAADCYAAERLGGENRPAVMAAARFLSRLGSVRFDAAHPPGSQRAAAILSCLPPEVSADVAHAADATGVVDAADAAGVTQGNRR